MVVEEIAQQRFIVLRKTVHVDRAICFDATKALERAVVGEKGDVLDVVEMRMREADMANAVLLLQRERFGRRACI